MQKKITKKKLILIILLCVVVFVIGGWGMFCVKMYDENFNVRGDSYEPLMLRLEDFSGLRCTEYTFPSDHGQRLAGYLYSAGEEQKGVVVIAHGFGGGGHNSYMDAANYFAQHGWYVFAYGYDKYYEKYKDDARFTFVRFDDKGHNDILNDPENTYKDEFNAEFDQWLETLDYDYTAEENKDRFIEEKAEYITNNLDHNKWSNRLDEDLFASFAAFYDKAVLEKKIPE